MVVQYDSISIMDVSGGEWSLHIVWNLKLKSLGGAITFFFGGICPVPTIEQPETPLLFPQNRWSMNVHPPKYGS